MGVNRFEDLIAWQKSHELVKNIYQITNSGEFSRDYGLRDQIRRASVSIMSNIAEGFERGSQADLHRFLVIAKASCAEERSQLYIALNIGYLSEQEFAHLMAKASEVSRVIGGLRKSVDTRNS